MLGAVTFPSPFFRPRPSVLTAVASLKEQDGPTSVILSQRVVPSLILLQSILDMSFFPDTIFTGFTSISV